MKTRTFVLIVCAALIPVAWWLWNSGIQPEPVPSMAGQPPAGVTKPVQSASPAVPRTPDAQAGGQADRPVVPAAAAQNVREVPASDRFPDAPVLSRSETTATDGTTVRIRIVRAAGKYPLLRVVDEISKDPLTGAERRIRQTAMVADHVVVKTKPGVTPETFRNLLTRTGATLRRSLPNSNLHVVGLPAATPDSVPDAVKTFAAETATIAFAEPDPLVHTETMPNDTRFAELWGMNNTGQTGGVPGSDIDAPEAWNLSTGSHSIKVGVVDTGIEAAHPDLAPNLWTNPAETAGNGIDDDGNGYIDDTRGWDFLNEDNDPMDDHGHGTHCAGTIGAAGNNSQGVTGVCWNVSLIGLKFIGYYGYGYTSDAAEATLYASSIGVRLTSNSWGGGGYSQALADAIETADAAGMLFIAAAGNDGMNTDLYPNYPSCHDSDNIISVAATDHTDTRPGFSNYGVASVDLAAPGVNILSCVPGGGYSTKSGTSMATPHVAGACALLWSRQPALTHDEVKSIVLSSTNPTPSVGLTVLSGGRLNVFNALQANLTVAPYGTVFINGTHGGPFTPSPAQYSLTNHGTTPLVWSLFESQAWWDASANGGTLNPGATIQIQISLTNEAYALAPGDYADALTFTDVSHGITISRQLTLNVLPHLACVPAGGLAASGHPGGPFTPSRGDFTLTNYTEAPVFWRATSNQPWVACTPDGGTLDPGSTMLSVDLNEAANSLPEGIHNATITITDGIRGETYALPVKLSITQDRFTEIFDNSSNDTAFQTFDLTPDAGSYTVRRSPAQTFPTDPAGGITLPATDDGFTQVTLTGGTTVRLFGTSYPAFFVGTNGYVTFGSGDSHLEELPELHFNLPRIAALFDDLNPAAGGSVTWKQLADRVAVTYQNVPEYSLGGSNSFQIEMFFNGRIRITILSITARDGLIGLSRGDGVPTDFSESDFTSYRPAPPMIVLQPLSVTARNFSYLHFKVEATGIGPLSYQWRHNGVDIPYSNWNYHWLSSAPENYGTYDVVVSNPWGSVTSDPAYLRQSPETLANGSFEYGLDGWSATGNVSIQSGPPYSATHGSGLLAFNAVNSPANGVLTQRFTTNYGGRYALEFDAGVLAYNTKEQRLQVEVAGSSTLLGDTVSIIGQGGGTVRWIAKKYLFTADSSITTITFRDVSPATISLDLLLDHVRVIEAHNLTVSTFPYLPSGTPVTISPADIDGNADGSTWLTRSYLEGSTVTLTAPAISNGYTFHRWSENGVVLGTNRTITVLMDGYTYLTAEYLPAAIPEITSATEATCILGHAFYHTIEATNSPVTFDAVPLPEGLSRYNNYISGVPTSVGTYDIALSATNHLGTGTATLKLTVVPGQPDYFTECFDYSANDTANQSFTFVPTSAPGYYQVSRRHATAFPSPPAGGTPLAPGADGSLEVTLGAGARVLFFGNTHPSFHVGSNGYVTFGAGDTSAYESAWTHLNLPRIAALFDDLAPDTGGSITWKQLADRAVVSYENIPERDYSSPTGFSGSNSFQIEMFFDGRIRITLLGINASDGLIGISKGTGMPADFVDSDFSNYPLENGLALDPPDAFVTSGEAIRGPFTPPVKSYVLNNRGTAAVAWSASTSTSPGLPSMNWLAVEPTGGTLAPGASVELQLTVTAEAGNLPIGEHTGVMSVTTAEGEFIRRATVNVLEWPPEITSPSTARGTIGLPFTHQIQASHAEYGFSASGLPAGLGIDFISGMISGIPAVHGIYQAEVTASGYGGVTRAALVITIDPLPPPFLSFNLASDPGWQRQGEWQFGTPAGNGGGNGFPDPAAAPTGSSVFGVNLGGNYSTAPTGPQYLVAGPFDLTECANTVLRYRRWLNTDFQPWVSATIEISLDGQNWTQAWNNGTSPVTDSSWQTVMHDLSAIADHQATVYLRWGHQLITGALPYSGWNIDDVEFLANYPLIVTTLLDENDGALGLGAGDSLREAIQAAAAIPQANEIRFAPSLDGGTIVLGGNELAIQDADGLTIDASALANGITVSGNHVSRVFLTAFGSRVEMKHLTITGGQADSGGAVRILDECEVTISDSRIADNEASASGGAIENHSFGGVTLTRCTLSGNRAATDGGAVINTGHLRVDQSTFSGNHSGTGGGAISSGFYHTSMTVTGSTFWNNSSDTTGGAIKAGSFTLTSCTLSGNTAGTSGGGIHATASTPFPELGFSLSDSIVSQNAAPAGTDIAGTIDTGSGSNFIGGDPRLEPIGDHGGPTHTLRPSSGSPVLDAVTSPAGELTEDQRGFARISGAAMDFGAVEVQQVTVNTLLDETDGMETGGISLRDAITAADSLDVELIRFSPDLDGGSILLSSGQIAMQGSFKIDGAPLPHGIRIDGGAATKLFDIPTGADILLDSLTMIRGKSATPGGCISNAGRLRLDRCTLAYCLSFGDGGAVWNTGSLELSNTTLAENLAAGSGGGVFNDGGARIEHATISRNSAFFSNGGGIRSTGPVTLLNSIVAENEAWDDPDVSGIPDSGSSVNLMTGDPMLAPLDDYGGPTPCMPPLPGSPVIDAAVLLATTPPTDQRYAPRPTGPLPDIGAVEAFPFSSLALIDSDEDLIDDRLEPAYQMSVGTDDSALDTDGDGSTDAEELANMTDPLDPGSCLKILSFAPAPGFHPTGNPVFDISFTSFPGLSYSIECDSNLGFKGPSARTYPLGVADDQRQTTRITLLQGRDFIRVLRNP